MPSVVVDVVFLASESRFLEMSVSTLYISLSILVTLITAVFFGIIRENTNIVPSQLSCRRLVGSSGVGISQRNSTNIAGVINFATAAWPGTSKLPRNSVRNGRKMTSVSEMFDSFRYGLA